MTPALRTVLIAIGAVSAVMGAIFAGQGVGVIPGSFMTGDRTWLFIGLAMLLIGVVLILVGTNRRKVS